MNTATTKILKQTEKELERFSVRATRFNPEKWDFANWLYKHIRVKQGGKIRPWSLEGFEPYRQIVQNMHKEQEHWVLKGAQIGFSTLMIGWNLYLPYWRGLDCGYALPDKVMIKPFMKTRFSQEQIRQNKVLKAHYRLHESDLYFDCGANYIYFLGANVLSEALSRPMEQLSLDEVTIIKRDAIELIQERLDAAEFGQLNGFAREIYPGGPADQGFQDGRQNVYLFKCPACGHWQNLEELIYESSLNRLEIPSCITRTAQGWSICCVQCGKAYSRKNTGQWVARHPDREVQSYRVPQVIFESKPLDRFMRKWRRTAKKKSHRAKLHSAALAIPDAGDLQRISKDVLAQLKRPYRMRNRADWSIGGMDMGNVCYPVFADFADDVLQTIWWQEVDSDEVVDVVAKLIRDMNCMKFVIDALPLTPEARKLAYLFPDVVVLNYYKGDELKEKEADHLGNQYRVITQDRENALDSYCDLFVPEAPRIVFPARVVEADGREVDFEDSTFAMHHMRGSQKDETDDPRLGKKVYKFKKHIPNHFFHAGNYLATAMALLARDEGEFHGVVPIFGSFARD